MKKNLVTVVIPIHLEEPSALEKISLAQTVAVLHRHPIAFMTPIGLDTTWYEEFCRGKAAVRFERFDWRGHEAHGELQTNPAFYARFLPYEYMLVVHMDAFVFRDELEKWCRAGYDYAGAVIYNPVWQNPGSALRRLTGFNYPEYFGNGGFSLKKTSTFHRLTTRFRFYINAYHWVRRRRKLGFLDDLFLAQHFPKLSASFRIMPKALAQQFGAAYEFGNAEDLPFTNQDNDTLPFGIHGWIQYQPEYWKPVIRRYGHLI